MEEHPVDQPIESVRLPDENGVAHWYVANGCPVTRIEACQKSGPHANLPYVRVWEGEQCVGEFCQHHLLGVYFAKKE